MFGDAVVTPQWRLVPLLMLVSGCAPAVTPLPAPSPVPPPVERPVDVVRPAPLPLARRHETVRYTVRSRSQLTQDSAGTPPLRSL